MEDQWELMNKRLIELEEATRLKVEKLNAQLGEKDMIIQRLTSEIEQLKESASSRGGEQIQEMQEQLNVYQEMIKQLEAEKRELQNELQAAQEKAGSSDEQAEQIGVLQEMIKQIEAEKRELQNELQTAQEKAGSSDEQAEQIGVLQEMIKQLEAEKRESEALVTKLRDEVKKLEAEKIKAELKAVKGEAKTPTEVSSQYEATITNLTEEKSLLEAQVEDLKKELEEQANKILQDQGAVRSKLEEENTKLKNEIQNLKDQISTLNTQAAQAAEYESKVKALQSENEALKKSITEVEKDLDELVEINRNQAEKIEKLEQDLIAATSKAEAVAVIQHPPPSHPSPQVTAPVARPQVTPTSTMTVSAPQAGGIRYFTFKNDTYVPTTGPSPDITLTLDEKAGKWHLSIAPGTSFLTKNKALRLARSLPNTGWKDPKTNERLGKDFEIEIEGEY
ncbi:MAG: hypothetical protein ACTSRS_04470 [Candidatus Helarchaeota archaeon]